MTIRVGFLLIGDGNWSGGLNYQRTLLQLFVGPLAGRIEACVMVAPEHEELAQRTFGEFLRLPLVVDSRVVGAGSGWRAAKALVTGSDKAIASLVRENDIEVMFENARFFGLGFPIPVISWMPDFQHRHLSSLFSRTAWWKRELGYRAQGLGRRVVLLSSEAARRDCEEFYPRTSGRTVVARFSGQVDLEAVYSRAIYALAVHNVPERFFFLPNQFWIHKNHGLVVEALRRIKRVRGTLDGFPPVIMSGSIKDPRDPGLFERSSETVASEGLSPWFRHLGMIDYGDVLALNASAIATLNPSLFEGWASSVEEAKSLGTPLVISDINVHREQAPGARFFGVRDAQALAAHLMEIADEHVCDRADLVDLTALNASRLAEFARAFEDAVDKAQGLEEVPRMRRFWQ